MARFRAAAPGELPLLKNQLREFLHVSVKRTGFKLKPHLKQRWLEELRSGLYEQGDNELCDGAGRYCCLGVYVEAEEKRTWILNPQRGTWHVGDVDSNFLPQTAIPLIIQEDLAHANDCGLAFADIADVIEECL